MTTVSVCIPTYEQPQLAARAVHSAMAQKGCEFEIIISDDSRTDCVREILAPIISNKNVRYFKNRERLGAVANWNAAINKAVGKVIKILHHDDWLAGNWALSQFSDPILNGHTRVVFSACNQRAHDESLHSVHCASQQQIEALRRNPSEILFANFLGAPSVLAISSTIKDRFDEKYLWVADLEFYSRLLKEVQGSFSYISTPLINVSMDLPSQITRTFETQQHLALFEYARAFHRAGLTSTDKNRARQLLYDFSRRLPRQDLKNAAIKAIIGGEISLFLYLARLDWKRHFQTK